MRAWGSNSILRCAENWYYFRNSGILFRKQWKVLQMPDQQTCTTEYRIPYFLEEFFITEERLKCCQADRPFTWFVWDWVKWWFKKMLVDFRVVTSKLRGEHMKLPKGNPHAFPEGSKNCPLAHYSYDVISSLFSSTTAFTNISVSNWCCFDPREFLLQIHSTSGNQWGLLDRGFQLFPLERILLADAKMSYRPQTSMMQLDTMEDLHQNYVAPSQMLVVNNWIAMEDEESSWKVYFKTSREIKNWMCF